MSNQKSPFPGMDPYLEAKWPEVHARLIVYSANMINRELPDDLQANIEENLAVRYQNGEESDDALRRTIRPDVNVAEDKDEYETADPDSCSSVAVAKPKMLQLPPHPDRHVEIQNRNGKIVTAIEFLSPWNKAGVVNREQYVRKQLDYLAAGVNLVEIDLVRQGKPVMLNSTLKDGPEKPWSGYGVCVYRACLREQLAWYSAPLQERLPNIPVPLRADEDDVVLQLQSLIDDCYADGRYYRTNYASDPQPTLDGGMLAWVDGTLKQSGQR